MTDRLLSPEAAAAWLGFSKSALNQWRMAGKGPAFVKIGRAIRYRESDLLAFVKARIKGEAIADGKHLK